MAKIVRLPGNPGPANPGEDEVLQHLAKQLPELFELIPNLTIPFVKSGAEEYDIIAVGPDGVFVIEVKTIAGEVEITEQQMFVNGEIRANPWNSSRIKAQKLATKLQTKFGQQNKVWVEHVVVFSREPRKLSVAPAYEQRVFVTAEALAPKLMSPSPLIHPKGHGLHRGRVSQIVESIIDGALMRDRQKVFREYVAVTKLHEVAGPGGYAYWNAEHKVHGGLRLLQVFPEAEVQGDQLVARRHEAQRRVEAAELIGPSADVIAPLENFLTEIGEYVLVWPFVDSPSLGRWLEMQADLSDNPGTKPLTDAKARALLEGFARAYADVHRAGLVFGKLEQSAFVVRPTGRGAVVLQYPVPSKSSEQLGDLRQLAEIADLVVVHAVDGESAKIVMSFKDALSTTVRAELPSAAWLAAACQIGLGEPAAANRLADYFEGLEVLASHSFGKTYRATSKRLKRPVVVRVENGRPGRSWVDCEAAALTRPQVLEARGVVRHLESGIVAEGSYVATEWLEGISLMSLLDSGSFREVSDAIGATLQILESLRLIHPDMALLDQLLDDKTPLGSAQLRNVEKLRGSGFAHNHIEPSNIIWVEDRGPVLIDFARAADFGREIPVRLSMYWPTDAPRGQSNPTADLYSVGLMLLVMLTGPLNPHQNRFTFDDRIQDVAKASRELALVISKAIATDEKLRFRSATEFIDALAAIQLGGVKVPRVRADLQLVREVEALVTTGRFDEALTICAEKNWKETAASIERKRELAQSAGRVLVTLDGVTLSYVGSRDVGPGTTGSNSPYEKGKAEVYVARLADGGVMEIHTVSAYPHDDENVQLPIEETWVQGDLEYGLPAQMKLLADRRRLVVMPLSVDGEPMRNEPEDKKKPVKGKRKTEKDRKKLSEMSEERYCQIRQLQLASRQPEGERWDATNKKVTVAQLSAGAGGVEIAGLFREFGATAFGTRETVLGDTSKLRGDLCVRFNRQEIHVPAITFLVARLLPLKNKVRARDADENDE